MTYVAFLRGDAWFSLVGDSGIVARPGSWLTRVVIIKVTKNIYLSVIIITLWVPFSWGASSRVSDEKEQVETEVESLLVIARL